MGCIDYRGKTPYFLGVATRFERFARGGRREFYRLPVLLWQFKFCNDASVNINLPLINLPFHFERFGKLMRGKLMRGKLMRGKLMAVEGNLHGLF